jgi:hypothetical protein
MIQQTNNKIWNTKNNKLQILPEFKIQSPLHINKMNQTSTDSRNLKKINQSEQTKQKEINIETKLPSVIIEGRGSS